jgi:hypothetical protein
MEITVTPAYEALASARVQMFVEPFIRLPHGRRDTRRNGRVLHQGGCACKSGRIAVDHPGHARRAAAIGPVLRDFVGMRDRRRQQRHQGLVERVARGEPVEQIVLVEAHHLDEPVDRSTGAADGQSRFRPA